MSEEAKNKEGTNKKPFYKKVWFWAIVVVVVICVGAAGAASDKDPKKVGENGDISSEENGTSEFKVGDTVAIDNREMTIKSVKRNYTPEYLKVKDGKEYILVQVELTNKSDDKISYSSSEWQIEDGDGAIESYAAMANDEDDMLSLGELAAGGKKSGSIVFEVPKDDTKLKIHYKPNPFSNREAIVVL